ncbi:MAG: translation initiation factor IF-2, partial [Acidobacteriota bacterium]|nr:translation initiation factor IF-2 [Acidobacteriota bacterium]
VIAPPPTSAKERAQLLGRPLAAGRPGAARPDAPRPMPSRPAARPGARPGPRPGARPGPARYAPPGARGKRRGARKSARRRANEAARAAAEPAAVDAPVGEVTISEGITIKDLAERMERKAKDVIKTLFLEKGVMATINHALDEDTARWVVESFGGTIDVVDVSDEAAVETSAEIVTVDAPEDLRHRPPVVTMMGHVDHGKTSLLDAIRTARVAEREAGGITQHIGAYKISHEREGVEKEIVFLDTPGHEAFTLMRARGARVTDIVVLVVAADDGVMPQTLEAINHAKAAGAPLIIAVNKIDKPEANPDRVLQQLAERDVLVEQFGGEVIAVNVSAKTHEGLESLLEMILLQAEVNELKANPDRPATGTVLEAQLDRARGPVATVLVQNGTLRKSDFFVVGSTIGRVRALVDERNQQLDDATPATPVVVMGIEDVPSAGDVFQVFPDEQRARQLAIYRQQKLREEELSRRATLPSVERLFEQIREGQVNELAIVLKADVAGSAETLQRTLADLSTDEVRVNVIHASPGAITETDIMLASASRAIVIGFNVRPERGVADIAQREGVDLRLHTVIYKVAEEIKQAMLATLSPVENEVYLGRAAIREIFRIPKIGLIAGCIVTDGLIKRDARVRVLRDNVVIHEGKVGSLRRFKDDAKEVRSGFECGISIERFQDVKPNDEIEAFTIELSRRESLESKPSS